MVVAVVAVVVVAVAVAVVVVAVAVAVVVVVAGGGHRSSACSSSAYAKKSCNLHADGSNLISWMAARVSLKYRGVRDLVSTFPLVQRFGSHGQILPSSPCFEKLKRKLKRSS